MKTRSFRLPVVVYDNGGVTADQYTVCIENGGTWAVYTMSDNPGGYMGINQYSHHTNHPEDVKITVDREVNIIPVSVYKAIKDYCKVY